MKNLRMSLTAMTLNPKNQRIIIYQSLVQRVARKVALIKIPIRNMLKAQIVTRSRPIARSKSTKKGKKNSPLR
jgi:hypothetical protein